MTKDHMTAHDQAKHNWLTLTAAITTTLLSVISLWFHHTFWLYGTFILSLITILFIVMTKDKTVTEPVTTDQAEQFTIQHIKEVNDLQTELEKQRQFEKELKQSKLAAESAAMAKSEFLATMSHEIRTPLNGIIPMLEMLANSKLTVDQIDILRTAQSSANLMRQIVDDILDYSKLEANKLTLETTSLNIRDIIYFVVQMFNGQAEQKKIAINIHLDPALRLAMRGDPVRLRQVLSNLLSNAIKFTDKGSINISVRAKSESKQHHILRFEIKDTGIGISPENANRLFKPFSQADATTTRIYGGTGLGLVICKRIIDLMSGQIGVNSQAGLGSTFWFEVPMLKTVGDSQALASEIKHCSILLYSNDSALMKKFEQANQILGTKLHFAETAIDAQKMLQRSVSVGFNTDYDLLIIDVSSGRQSALQLQKSIIENSEFNRIRIALLSNTDSGVVELYKEPRCKIFPRNTEITQLLSDLNQFISSTVNTLDKHNIKNIEPSIVIQSENLESKSDTPHGMVLLVEDNPINLLVAQRLLTLSNFDYVSAENGQVALELLHDNIFDLVLMDCQMPVMDGYQATRTWRQFESTSNAKRRMPIIAMTANAMAEDRQKCLDSGMDDYLSKPVDRKLLKHTLLKWLNQGTTQSELPALPKSPESTESALLQSAEPTDPASVLDNSIVDDLREFMGSDYQSLIRIYLEDSPKLLQQIQMALSNQDATALIGPAHTLKSSSANLGAMRLSKLAALFEKNARSGSLVVPNQEVTKLNEEFNQVINALNKLLDQ